MRVFLGFIIVFIINAKCECKRLFKQYMDNWIVSCILTLWVKHGFCAKTDKGGLNAGLGVGWTYATISEHFDC